MIVGSLFSLVSGFMWYYCIRLSWFICSIQSISDGYSDRVCFGSARTKGCCVSWHTWAHILNCMFAFWGEKLAPWAMRVFNLFFISGHINIYPSHQWMGSFLVPYPVHQLVRVHFCSCCLTKINGTFKYHMANEVWQLMSVFLALKSLRQEIKFYRVWYTVSFRPPCDTQWDPVSKKPKRSYD